MEIRTKTEHEKLQIRIESGEVQIWVYDQDGLRLARYEFMNHLTYNQKLHDRELLDYRQIAAILNCSTRTAQRYARQGNIKSLKIGQSRRFFVCDVVSFIQQRLNEKSDIHAFHMKGGSTCKTIEC